MPAEPLSNESFPSVDTALRAAAEQLRAGQLPRAESILRAVLQAQPKHAEANSMLGALALQVGKPEASLPFLKNALETQPADAQHWVKYCEALVACGRLDAARSVLAQAEKRGLPDAAIDSRIMPMVRSAS